MYRLNYKSKLTKSLEVRFNLDLEVLANSRSFRNKWDMDKWLLFCSNTLVEFEVEYIKDV